MVDAESMKVSIDLCERKKGMSLREAIIGLEPWAHMAARTFLATVPYLNFLRMVAPAGFCDLRSG